MAEMRRVNVTRICFACAAAALTAFTAFAAEQDFDIAGVSGTAWLPAAGAHMQPVIVFSHGFHGCPTQSRFLMIALANAGYAVFAPRHADAACGNLLKWTESAEQPFRDADKWTDATYADRRQQIEKLLDAAPRDSRFAGFDWSRIGLAGHSLGGYTVMGVAGAWPAWKDSRVRAVLALSPYSAPFIYRHTLSSINAPVMYQGGTRDSGITPFLNKGGGAFDETPAPKFYVELSGAGHFAWTNINPFYRSTIDSYSIAFFDTYLKGKPFPQQLLAKGKDVSDIRVKMQ